MNESKKQELRQQLEDWLSNKDEKLNTCHTCDKKISENETFYRDNDEVGMCKECNDICEAQYHALRTKEITPLTTQIRDIVDKITEANLKGEGEPLNEYLAICKIWDDYTVLMQVNQHRVFNTLSGCMYYEDADGAVVDIDGGFSFKFEGMPLRNIKEFLEETIINTIEKQLGEFLLHVHVVFV